MALDVSGVGYFNVIEPERIRLVRRGWLVCFSSLGWIVS
jgi:hypothetical protein